MNTHSPLRLLLICATLALLLGACGQKGDLYLPDRDDNTQRHSDN